VFVKIPKPLTSAREIREATANSTKK